MKKFDKTNIKQVRSELEEALSLVSESFGINIKVGNLSYNNSEFTAKVEASIKGAVTKEETAYNFYAKLEGDLPGFGETVMVDGDKYVISGWNTRARKYPIIGINQRTNQRYRLTVPTVQMAYNR